MRRGCWWRALRQQGDKGETNKAPQKGTSLCFWFPHCCRFLSLCVLGTSPILERAETTRIGEVDGDRRYIKKDGWADGKIHVGEKVASCPQIVGMLCGNSDSW